MIICPHRPSSESLNCSTPIWCASFFRLLDCLAAWLLRKDSVPFSHSQRHPHGDRSIPEAHSTRLPTGMASFAFSLFRRCLHEDDDEDIADNKSVVEINHSTPSSRGTVVISRRAQNQMGDRASAVMDLHMLVTASASSPAQDGLGLRASTRSGSPRSDSQAAWMHSFGVG